jgi:hypothetical protein
LGFAATRGGGYIERPSRLAVSTPPLNSEIVTPIDVVRVLLGAFGQESLYLDSLGRRLRFNASLPSRQISVSQLDRQEGDAPGRSVQDGVGS